MCLGRAPGLWGEQDEQGVLTPLPGHSGVGMVLAGTE